MTKDERGRWPEWTYETQGNGFFWDRETGEFNPDMVVHLGAGVIVPKCFNVGLGAGSMVTTYRDGSTTETRLFDKGEGYTNYNITFKWNSEKNCFLAKRLSIELDEDWIDGEINGTFLRTIKMQEFLQNVKNFQSFCVFRNIKDNHGYADAFNPSHVFMKINNEQPEKLAAKGPVPDVLLFVARVYLLESALSNKPHQYIEHLLQIPSRTASHWIKLAKERGYFDKSNFQECEDFINGAA